MDVKEKGGCKVKRSKLGEKGLNSEEKKGGGGKSKSVKTRRKRVE